MPVNRDNYFSQEASQGSFNGNYMNYSTGDALRDADLPWLSAIWNDLTGQTSQQREFAQQEYLQDKMNEYNSPVEEMKRQKDAGINPNLSAQGIAQAGSQSSQAPAVASNAGGVAQGVSAVAGAAETIGNLSLLDSQRHVNESTANLNEASADSTTRLLPVQIRSMIAETTKTLVDAKLDKYQARYWSVQAMYASKEKMLDMFGKFFQVKEATSRIRLLRDEHKMNKERLNILKEQVSQEEYRSEMMRIDQVLKQGIEKVYTELGVDITLPETGMAIQASESGVLDKIMDVFESVEYHKQRGALDAKVDTAFDEAFNSALGSAHANAAYAPYLAKIEAQKQALVDCMKMILDNPSDIKGYVAKFVNLIANIFTADSIDNSIVQKAKRPVPNPSSSHHRVSTSMRW